jgi:hypothetical protein
MATVAIKEQVVDGETVIYLGPSVLVKSKSEPGTWYSVENGRCSCKGFTYRRSCRHLAVAALATEIARRDSVAIEAVPLHEDDAREMAPCFERERDLVRRIFGDRKPTEVVTLRDDLA